MKPDYGHQRFEKAMAVLDALSKDELATSRLLAACEAIHQIELTGSSNTVRESIETWGVQYNRSMHAAQEASGDKEATLSEPEAVKLESSLRATCELIRSVESEEVLSRLREPKRRMPVSEVDLIRRYRDWFVPILLQESLACTEELEQGKSDATDADSSLPFFTLILASELELPEFMPILLRGVVLPGEPPFDLYGDAIHDYMPRYLAQFSTHEIDRIDKLVLEPSHNTYVRWAAANSYKFFVRDKVLTLEEAVHRLDRLFELTKVTSEDNRPGLGHEYELSAGIVEVIASIGGGAISTIGDSPEQWKYIDDTIIHADDFVSSVAPTDGSGLTEELLALAPTRVEDSAAELRSWDSCDEEMSLAAMHAPVLKPASRPDPVVPQTQLQTVATTAIRADRTPRNADCPCGSGKKYKKCCLRA